MISADGSYAADVIVVAQQYFITVLLLYGVRVALHYRITTIIYYLYTVLLVQYSCNMILGRKEGRKVEVYEAAME